MLTTSKDFERILNWPEARLYFPIEPPDLKDWFAHHVPKPLGPIEAAVVRVIELEILDGKWTGRLGKNEGSIVRALEIKELERMYAARGGR